MLLFFLASIDSRHLSGSRPIWDLSDVPVSRNWYKTEIIPKLIEINALSSLIANLKTNLVFRLISRH